MTRLVPIATHSFPPPKDFSIAPFEQANFSPTLQPLKIDVIGDIGNVLWVLMGGIAIVLLVACANVANLLLVRIEGRRQELAIRAALGADRKNMVAGLLLESLVLGCAGSAIGLGLAYGALNLIVAAAPTGLPRAVEFLPPRIGCGCGSNAAARSRSNGGGAWIQRTNGQQHRCHE